MPTGRKERRLQENTRGQGGLHTKNDLVWKWFCMARLKNIIVTGRLLQEKALMLSVEMGHDDFPALNGRLESFKKINGITEAVLCGEAADIPEDVAGDWMKRSPEICAVYDIKDIFKVDKVGLFYRTLLNCVLVVKGDTCEGGKRVKD